MPAGYTVNWAGEGEWKITLDVFRDLGLAFGAALVGIFVILMFETGSRMLPLVIMLAIPLTMIGIMPGFWLLERAGRPAGRAAIPNPVFFTATAMIGMIALAGHRGPQLGRADRLHPPRQGAKGCRCARR